MLEGYKQNEIAKITGFTLTKVERKIAIVRKQWDSARDGAGDSDDE